MGPLLDGYGDAAVQMALLLFVVKKNKNNKKEINRKSRLCYVKNYNSTLTTDS